MDSSGNGQGVIDQVDQALAVGFNHIGEVWTFLERELLGRAMVLIV